MGVVRAGAGGGPLDGVDLLGVRREVVQRRALAQAPDLGGVVVRARRQQLACAWTPASSSDFPTFCRSLRLSTSIVKHVNGCLTILLPWRKLVHSRSMQAYLALVRLDRSHKLCSYVW